MIFINRERFFTNAKTPKALAVVLILESINLVCGNLLSPLVPDVIPDVVPNTLTDVVDDTVDDVVPNVISQIPDYGEDIMNKGIFYFII